MVDEFLVRGQLVEYRVNLLPLNLHKLVKFLITHHVHNGVIVFWFNTLPQHHLGPAVLAEYIADRFEHAAGIAKQIQAMLQCVRNIDVPAATPELGI